MDTIRQKARYAAAGQRIPQSRRAETNERILAAIRSGENSIEPEAVYNSYTGLGGLHSLRQADFAGYHEYAEAKRNIEMGQYVNSAVM
jgi:hypothetical protein